MHGPIETPTPETVKAACERFDRDNEASEHALAELFRQYPQNTDLRHVLREDLRLREPELLERAAVGAVALRDLVLQRAGDRGKQRRVVFGERRLVLSQRRAPGQHGGVVVERVAHRGPEVERRRRSRLSGRAEKGDRGARGPKRDDPHR